MLYFFFLYICIVRSSERNTGREGKTLIKKLNNMKKITLTCKHQSNEMGKSKVILKGNMPNDDGGCFFSITCCNGNIVFSTLDNNKKKLVKDECLYREVPIEGYRMETIIKSEDELIEKLMSTSYINDEDTLEHIKERFNYCDMYLVDALGVGGDIIVSHLKEKLYINHNN